MLRTQASSSRVQPAPLQLASDGMNRLQMQRPTLPPLPDDLSTGGELDRKK
jgi:hypothetical protein